MPKSTRIREIQAGPYVIPVHACSSCGAEILWATTTREKAHPVDLEPNEAGTWALKLRPPAGAAGTAKVLCFYRQIGSSLEPGEKRRTSHWATCPNAHKHRSKQ